MVASVLGGAQWTQHHFLCSGFIARVHLYGQTLTTEQPVKKHSCVQCNKLMDVRGEFTS